MRVWQRWSAVVGGDVSWGVSNQLGKFMRVVPLDLEDTASTLLGPARAQRIVKVQEELLALTTLADEVRASDDYRTLAQAQDKATAMYVSLLDGDRIVQVTNAAFDRLLESGGDMGSRVLLHRTTPVLLLGQLVAPDDREAFYEGYMRFSVPSRREKSTYFLKWFTGDGEIKLCIVSSGPCKWGTGTVCKCWWRWLRIAGTSPPSLTATRSSTPSAPPRLLPLPRSG